MKGLQALGLVGSLGIAAATNHFMKPRVTYDMPIGDRSMATGTLWLQDAGVRRELPVVTWNVIAADVPRVFAKPVLVRELWLRSPEGQTGEPSDLELFVDFGGQEGQVLDAQALHVESLRGLPLPVLGVALGSEASSRVRLPGSPAALLVTSQSTRTSTILIMVSLVGYLEKTWKRRHR